MTLIIDHLSKQFVKNGKETVDSLLDINVEIRDGEFICILGPSGCGKTTLLRIIAGLESPTSGQVLIDGTAIERPNPKLGMIFQDYSLYPWRTVNENIAFGLELRGVGKVERDKIGDEYLELAGLSGFGNSYPYELSGGMRQRVAVVRALAVDPVSTAHGRTFRCTGCPDPEQAPARPAGDLGQDEKDDPVRDAQCR